MRNMPLKMTDNEVEVHRQNSTLSKRMIEEWGKLPADERAVIIEKHNKECPWQPGEQAAKKEWWSATHA